MAGPTIARRVVAGVQQLVLGIVAVLGALVVYKQLIFPVIGGLFHPAGRWHTIVARSGSLAAVVCAYVGFVRLYKKRSPSELRIRRGATILGAAAGVALISITLATLFATGFYVVDSYRGFSAATPIVLTIVSAAMLEEIVFRGLLFRIAEQHVGTLSALSSISLLFGILHVFNDGTTPATVVSVTLLGALWCGIFALSRNLWVTGLNHAAWNLAIFLSGIPLSGQEEWRTAAPFVSHAHGPEWLTGGSFGPEDSVITIAVLAAAISVLLWVQRNTARRSGPLSER